MKHQIRTGDVYLSPRMEELLIKLYREETCSGYSHYVATINALFRRNLVANTFQPYDYRNFRPHEVTRRGKEIAEKLLNKEP